MTEAEFRDRLMAAIREEYINRPDIRKMDDRHRLGDMYSKLAAEMVIYDLNIHSVRDIVLEYYDRGMEK